MLLSQWCAAAVSSSLPASRLRRACPSPSGSITGRATHLPRALCSFPVAPSGSPEGALAWRAAPRRRGGRGPGGAAVVAWCAAGPAGSAASAAWSRSDLAAAGVRRRDGAGLRPGREVRRRRLGDPEVERKPHRGRAGGRRALICPPRRVPRPLLSGCVATPAIAKAEDQNEAEVEMGYTMTEICDKFIEFFMQKKPETKDWRKVLAEFFREEWQRYRKHFYKHCQVRIDMETDSSLKQKLVVLARKVKKIDDEIEKHMELFTELRDNPADINAIVARRRKDFTGEFFRHLNFLVNAYNGLDERDGVVRLGAKCLSAIHAYDCTLEQLDIESAQSKFDDILNSSSLEDACDKIKSLAKAKELDSSLILLINRAWAAAKDSSTMNDKVKDIMYHIYTTTKESLKSISPPEMKLLKYLLNIEDPEERFGALATAFSPGDEREAKDEDGLYTTPNELHKWIKMMLDSYHLNKEETDFMDARKMSDPVIIQRLTSLKETIEEEYMKQYIHPDESESMDDESD